MASEVQRRGSAVTQRGQDISWPMAAMISSNAQLESMAAGLPGIGPAVT